LQSIGKNAESPFGDPQPHAAGEGIVLPRLLRRPVRQAKRLLNGGFHVTGKSLVLAGLVFAGAAGGIGLNVHGGADAVFAKMAPTLGFAITQYEISGNHEVSDVEVVSLLSPDYGRSILGYDVDHGRTLLKTNPWVADASVSKLYPDKLAVNIIERQPFALWQNEYGLHLIDREGNVLADFDGRAHALPLVVGKGAETQSATMLGLMSKFPGISSRTTAFIRVGERRWDLKLDNGTIVMLPEDEQERQLVRLAKLDQDEDLFSKDIARIDMRLGDRLVVKLSAEAAESIKLKREGQIKELVSARKGREI
jgi:cell division protein FtsQ